MSNDNYVIKCVRCSSEITRDIPVEGDHSTFVCDVCQDKANLPAFEAEIDELQNLGDEATESQVARLGFLKAKVENLK